MSMPTPLPIEDSIWGMLICEDSICWPCARIHSVADSTVDARRDALLACSAVKPMASSARTMWAFSAVCCSAGAGAGMCCWRCCG